MDLKDIMAISGKPGLYKFISQGRNAMIVENLENNTRMSAFASDKVSTLEDIAIFTEDQDVPIKDVLKNIFDKENGRETISHKSANEELKTWFESILPDYDRDRVYVSDIKKVIQWYNILQKMEMLVFEDVKENETGASEESSKKESEEKTDS